MNIIWQKILSLLGKKSKEFIENQKYVAKDESILILPDLIIKLNRYTNLETPTEVTMVVPRVEIRHNHKLTDGSSVSSETLLNSVTVVSAPRHPAEEPSGVVPKIPFKDKFPPQGQPPKNKKSRE